MSVLAGGAGVVLALIAEEVLVTSRGGPAAVAGLGGTIVRGIDRLADPSIPLIPDRTAAKARAPRVKPTTSGATAPKLV